MDNKSNILKLYFIHPVDGRELNVEIDSSMTAKETIDNLISAGFIQPSTEGYKLAVKGGTEVNGDQTFGQAGVATESRIRVIHATDAGIPIAVN